MSTIPFSEAYCLRHNLPPERFERAVLARALYPRARILAPIIQELWPEHFAADLDFVRGAGLLRRARDFTGEARDFVHHPANTGWLRQTLRLRVSVQRLRRLVHETLHEVDEGEEPVADTSGSSVAPAA